MKIEDMTREVKQNFKWFKLGCLAGGDGNILDRFETVYFSVIKHRMSLNEWIEKMKEEEK